ncbi:MAG: LysM peptidoglycan-binding domain-containing protein [Desulfobacterales bacterium]
MMIRFLYLFLLLICFGCTTPHYDRSAGNESAAQAASKNSSHAAHRAKPGTPPASPDSTLADESDEDIGAILDEESEDDTEEEEVTGHPVSDTKEIQKIMDEAMNLCATSQEYRGKGETEKALASLDRAFSLILKVDPEDNVELLEQKEEIRYLVSKRILEIYASRNTTAKGSHRAIPAVDNPYVRQEIEYLSKGSFFAEAYKRSGRYRPFILEELKKAGLPAELSWLPLIESGFKVRALSPARALGIWQFIPSTGYRFGLSRDKYVDERMDPYKSTKAAIAYLKELHEMFGDWSTVLAAYNCGEGRVLKTIRSQNVNYLDNFWDLYEKLPGETARYVPRFLATVHMVSHPKEYGLDSIETDSPPQYEEMTVSKQMHVKDVAEAIGISPTVLKSLNPELKHDMLPPQTYSLKVPAGKRETLVAKLDSIPLSSAPKLSEKSETTVASTVYHRIKRGETLARIAKRYGTSGKAIMRANKIHRRNYLVAGNILKIPVKKGNHSGASAVAQRKTKQKRKAVSTHIVKKGDSLWNIAQKYGIMTKDIKKVNKLSGATLNVGQALVIPKSASGSSEKRLKTYKVRNGDVPLEIAKRHNMSLEDFLRVNRLTNRSRIFPGQKVYVE